MRWNWRIVLLLGVCCWLHPAGSPALTIPQTAQGPIIQRAYEFILLLDQHKPREAWAQMTLYFRKKLSLQSWQRLYRNQRLRFGLPLERRLDGYRFFSTFEKATDGLYLEVRFRTDFEARANVSEQVVMYKDFDGRWRVIGYFIELE